MNSAQYLLNAVASSSTSRIGLLNYDKFGAVADHPLRLDPLSAYSLPQGTFALAGAPWPSYVANNSSADVVVKPEDCEVDFYVLHPGDRYRSRTDGVKPPGWFLPGHAPFSQDWFKVVEYVGVSINASGLPSKTTPTPFAFVTILFSECNYFDNSCRINDDDPDDYYHGRGGRKEEPEWSQLPPSGWPTTAPWKWHGEWRYPTPPQFLIDNRRDAACKTEFRTPAP